VITKRDVMPLLLAACPSFAEVWAAYDASGDRDDGSIYLDLIPFIEHLVALLARGETDAFPAVFAVVERLHLEGDDSVREAATVGLLEGLFPDTAFVPFLLPESARWWAEIEGFWSGTLPYIGAGHSTGGARRDTGN
jgi:hypothetical protein